MKPEPPREEALFQAAGQLNGPNRAAFLDQACAQDPALRARLDALLAAHEQPETLLATQVETARPTIKLELADAPDEAVGQTLGRYKLLERVGEGGCGVVYVAEQTDPVRRRVALKVIKRGMDTKQAEISFPLGFTDSGRSVVGISTKGFIRTDTKSGTVQPMAGWPDAFEPPNVDRAQSLNVRVATVVVSRDGTRAAALLRGRDRVQVWNILSRTTERILTNSAGAIRSFGFTPDDDHLVVSGPDWQTRVLSITGQSFRLIGDSASPQGGSMAISLDGSRLAQMGDAGSTSSKKHQPEGATLRAPGM